MQIDITIGLSYKNSFNFNEVTLLLPRGIRIQKNIFLSILTPLALTDEFLISGN
jgi:hypothetical protein